MNDDVKVRDACRVRVDGKAAPMTRGSACCRSVGHVIGLCRNLALWRQLAWVLLSASSFFLVVSLGYALSGGRYVRLPKIDPAKVRAQDHMVPGRTKTLQEYLQAVEVSDAFAAGTAEEAGAVIMAADSASVQDVVLVGVIGDKRLQAIIEDKKSHATYTVQPGQMVGEMRIEDVQRRKVIIQYRGELYELSL